jgi:hypothetical protein
VSAGQFPGCARLNRQRTSGTCGGGSRRYGPNYYKLKEGPTRPNTQDLRSKTEHFIDVNRGEDKDDDACRGDNFFKTYLYGPRCYLVKGFLKKCNVISLNIILLMEALAARSLREIRI